ncbi:MAG: hypothetical protein ACYTFY_22250, partial [Planctomycetota bacterium]
MSLPDNRFCSYGDGRNEAIHRFSEDYHLFANTVKPFNVEAGEVLIDSEWSICCTENEFKLCAEDFAEFFAKMDCSIAVSDKQASKAIVINKTTDSVPFIEVQTDLVSINAADLRSCWRAVVFLERKMAVRHAPVLAAGKYELPARFKYRIATSLFSHGFEKPTDEGAYNDDYLRSMVHAGYTSFFMYINLWDFCKSSILPELVGEDADFQLEELDKLSKRANRFGLKLVLLVNAPRFMPDHAVFKSHPELKGAGVMRETGNALCTSETLTHEFYAEQMKNLCEKVSHIEAFAFLIGGEGFLHCYTRPVPRTEHITNCEKCGTQTAAQTLLPLLNKITRAVKDNSSDIEVLFWPYSSFLWQKESIYDYDWSQDLELINNLDKGATWLLEFEKDGFFDDSKTEISKVYDYSIKFIGPSEKFRIEESAVSKRDEISIAVKTESNVDIAQHSVPYIPVMNRWAERHKKIAQSSAEGTWEMWRMIGFWDSPSSEVAYWNEVDPSLSNDEILTRIAERIYGKAAAADVGYFSQAWEYIYVFYGQGYWFGPFVQGPAHPFINAALQGICLYYSANRVPEFYQTHPGMRESETPEYHADPLNAIPRFITHTRPENEKRIADFTEAAALWQEGMEHLNNAFEKTPEALKASAQTDLDTAEMVGLFLEADLLYSWMSIHREILITGSVDPEKIKPVRKEMTELLKADLAGAERGLELVKRTPLLGWGYTFGVRMSAKMLESKIEITKQT